MGLLKRVGLFYNAPVSANARELSNTRYWYTQAIRYTDSKADSQDKYLFSISEVASLRKQTLTVVKKAVAIDADYERIPKTWLFHHRWGKSKTARTSRVDKIVHEAIGGRTAAWVPAVQS